MSVWGKWTPSLGDKPERRLSQAICRFATSVINPGKDYENGLHHSED